MKETFKLQGKIIILVILISSIGFFNSFPNQILTTEAASGIFSEDFSTTTYMDEANTNTTGWGTGAIENTKKKPTIIGSISSALIGNALDVFVDGNYAYVTNQGEGLKVVNITDSTNPSIIGSYATPNIAQSVFVDGDCAFITDYQGVFPLYENFLILNITDPTNPTDLGNCTTIYAAGDAARDVVVSNNLAFVANNEGGLSVVDITDPYNPFVISSRDTTGIASSLAIVDDYIYLADGTNGLVVIDVSNPLVPTIVTTFKTGLSSAINMAVEGNYIYVADNNNGIIVVNCNDPSAPVFAGSWSKSDVSDVNVYGDFLYVTDINDGLSVLNITHPTSPILINSLSLQGNAQKIFISEFYAYLTCFAGGFQVAQIADFSSSFVGSYDTPGSAYGVFVSEDYAYVASGYSGLCLFNISSRSAPTLIDSYDTVDVAIDVFVSGNFAYVADGNSGLQVIDISNPSSLSLAYSYNTPDYARDIFISGTYAYIADYASGLVILNISNPSSLTYVGSYNTPGIASGVFVLGDYAYIADSASGLEILDISDPSTPTLSGSIDPGFASSVFVSGNFAYITDSLTGLHIIDISRPSNPTLVSSCVTPGLSGQKARDIVVSGTYAYVADGFDSGMQIIDISNPFYPYLAGDYYISLRDTRGVFVSDAYAYLIDGIGLQIIEIRKNKANQFDSPCVAQSNTVFTASSAVIYSATLNSVETIPTSTSISYSLSADGGTNWETVTPGVEHFFTNSGNQLKWKAVLSTSDVSVSPEIYNLSINYTTILDAPALNTPSDSVITDDYTPTFTWYGINGESNYLFQLDTSTSFATPLVNITLPSSSTSYTPSSPLTEDTYYWRVAGIDSEGDRGSFSNYRTLYIIQDANPPTINHPSDFSYELGTTGNSITWTPADSNPYWYNITLNSILTSHDDPWAGGNIVMDIDGLPLGTYTVVCSVYDLEGLMISDTVNVEVVTTAPPTIDDVADFPYEEGTTGNSITWHPSDANPDYYSITRDGSVIDDGSWVGGDLSIDIDGLAYGVYTYVCTVNDTEGQEVSDTVVVTVTDSAIPGLNTPADVIYAEGDTGNNIIWVATDTNPGTYIVYKDGTFFESDTWISGSSIIISVDGLSSNQYNFTIVVVDQAGNSARDTVIVAVTAAVPELSRNSAPLFISLIALVAVLYRRKRRSNL